MPELVRGDLVGNGTVDILSVMRMINHIIGKNNGVDSHGNPWIRSDYEDYIGNIANTETISTVGISRMVNHIINKNDGKDENGESWIKPAQNVLYLVPGNKYNTPMQELRDFRRSQGYSIVTKTLSEDDSSSVDNIQNYINTIHRDITLKYVLIFGEIAEVPSYMLFRYEGTPTINNTNTRTAASDISYGLNSRIHDGGIDTIEIIVGRLSPGDRDNSHLSINPTAEQEIQNVQNQVDKIIQYENLIDSVKLGTQDTAKYSLDGEWIRKIVGIASAEGSLADGLDEKGIDDLADNDFIRGEIRKLYNLDKGLSYAELYDNHARVYNPFTDRVIDVYAPCQTPLIASIEEDSTVENDIADDNPRAGLGEVVSLTDKLEKGFPLMLYAGHANEVLMATTDFSVAYYQHGLGMPEVDPGKYFLACFVGCSIGSHDEPYTSLAEQFQIEKNKGSIAIFGSSVLQSWQPPQHMMRKLVNDLVEYITNQETKTIGEMFKSAVDINEFKVFGDFYFYHIFGDPTTRYNMTVPEMYVN